MKVTKLTDPRELKAAKEYLALSKKLKEHVSFLEKQHNDALVAAGVQFNKKFRELFVAATCKHLPDAEAAFAENSHLVLANSLEPESDLYLVSREDWNAHKDSGPADPVDHSAIFNDRVLH